MSNTELSSILNGKIIYEKFPMNKLKCVDRPTTLITDTVQRTDSRNNAFVNAHRGDYGQAVAREASHAATKDPLSNSLADVRRFVANNVPNEIFPTPAPIPHDPDILTRHIKRLGYFLSADIMAVSHMPDYAIYSHDMQGNEINLDYKYAIVIVMAKEYETLTTSSGTDWIGLSLSYDLYLRLAVLAETLMNYIRRLGYPASAEYTGKMGGNRVMFAPLPLWSSIGEISRTGLTLNPFLGIGYKAAAVLTDLPLTPDKPVDFGLQDFCRNCKICADLCPGNAIPQGEKTMHNGYETWKLNEQRCHSFRVLNRKGTYCGRCIRVCPWTRPITPLHNMVRWAVQHSSFARKIAIQASRAMKREKATPDDKWWFDLDQSEGEIKSLEL